MALIQEYTKETTYLQRMAHTIYTLGSPCVNKFITSSYISKKCCNVCNNSVYNQKYELTLHDKFHLMIPNILDINKQPAYLMSGNVWTNIYGRYIKDKNMKSMLAYHWLDDKTQDLCGKTLTVCKSCIVEIYTIIPKLAYLHAYKYFLICNYFDRDGHVDDDFTLYMIKSISYLVIDFLKIPLLWDEIGHDVTRFALQ